MGQRSPLFVPASSETHDRMVARFARDPGFTLEVMRRVWPEQLAGLGKPAVAATEMEVPVWGYNGYILGYVDVALSVTALGVLDAAVVKRHFYLECKSGRWTPGEVLRQVQCYQHWLPAQKRGVWTVVSPHRAHLEVLEQAGIAFWHMEIPSERLLASLGSPGPRSYGDSRALAILEQLRRGSLEPL